MKEVIQENNTTQTLTHDSPRRDPHNFCNHCGDLCEVAPICSECGSDQVKYCCDKVPCWAGCA